MHLVYDLRYASDHFPGVGTHAHALLRAMLSGPGDHRFRVLWGARDGSARFDLTWFERHERVEWVTVREPALGPWAPFATGRLLRRIGGDVYFSPFYLKPVAAPMPVVLTVHDALYLAPETGSSWLQRAKLAIALRHARGAAVTITPSEFTRAELIRLARFPGERVHAIAQGTPPRTAEPAERPAAAPARPYALVVGTNRPHKNLGTLVRAWRILGDDRPLELVACGPIDARYPSLDRLASAAGVAGTHTLGAVPPSQLDWLYAHATLVVFPSLYEGFGFPLLEASAYGIPVIASNIPALRELGNGVARYVAAEDAEAWAAAVRALAADGGAREHMRELGLALAARHDYAHVARRTLELIAELS